MRDGELRDEQKDYIAEDMFELMQRYGEHNKFDFSDISYKTFRKIYDFITQEYYGTEDIFAEDYKGDSDFENAGIDEDCESLEELERTEYVKNVINPQIDSLNAR